MPAARMGFWKSADQHWDWLGPKRFFLLGPLWSVVVPGLVKLITLVLDPTGAEVTVPLWVYIALFAATFLVCNVFFLMRRVQDLHTKLEPKLDVEKPSAYTMPKEPIGMAELRTFRVRVKNESSVLLTNCRVKLEWMRNIQGVFSKEEGRYFKPRQDTAALQRAPKKDCFNISPMDWTDIDLVAFAEENGGPLFMGYAVNQDIDPRVSVAIPRSSCPHVMRVQFSAENSTPIFRNYEFDVNSEGYLVMEEVNV